MQYETIWTNRATILKRELCELYTAQLCSLVRRYRISFREFLVSAELRCLQFLEFLLKLPFTALNNDFNATHNDPDDNIGVEQFNAEVDPPTPEAEPDLNKRPGGRGSAEMQC
jgi:hypothetical protein